MKRKMKVLAAVCGWLSVALLFVFLGLLAIDSPYKSHVLAACLWSLGGNVCFGMLTGRKVSDHKQAA